MGRSVSRLVLCAAVVAVGGACSDFFGLSSRSCTLIGCVNGLRITFDATPDSGTVVQAEVPGAAPWRVVCDVDQPCFGGVFFPEFSPDWLLVRITSPEGEVVHEVRPEYVVSRPNGPGCDPLCFIATVELALP